MRSIVMQERKALGKGLSSLIPLGVKSESGSKDYFALNLEDIVPNQNQPRKLFNKKAIDELAASIEEKGLLQPILVRKLGGGKYEIIAGERRYRAAQQLHLEKIYVILKEVEAEETLELALIENLQRQDLNPIEEALAYRDLLSKYQYTQDEVAKRIGRDRSSIANTIRLLKLPEKIRGYIISGNISMGHARTLLGVENRGLQEKIAEAIIENDLSVREIENWVNKLKEEQAAYEPSVSQKVKKSKPVERPYSTIEEGLKAGLQTKVQIKGSGKRGRIIIHFHSDDDLSRILSMIKMS